MVHGAKHGAEHGAEHGAKRVASRLGDHDDWTKNGRIRKTMKMVRGKTGRARVGTLAGKGKEKTAGRTGRENGRKMTGTPKGFGRRSVVLARVRPRPPRGIGMGKDWSGNLAAKLRTRGLVEKTRGGRIIISVISLAHGPLLLPDLVATRT